VPYSPPSRALTGPRRRTLLAGAAGAAALLTGCTSGGDGAGEGSGGSPSVAERARIRAARDSRALIQRYDAVLAAHPALAERLLPLREETVRHVQAFGGRTVGAAPSGLTAGSASPDAGAAPGASGDTNTSEESASATASGPAAPDGPATPPASREDALKDLARAERSLADARAAALLDVPGELARLLASVAAAGAAHAYLLTEAAR
jgi:hypothetical protein